MTKRKRKYSQKTIKILFALSGNQCAHPGCKNPIVVPPTRQSSAIIGSQICHIYALAEDGPRGKAGLTEEELNSPDNLILFCPTHHVIIDGQHESYPAKLLIQWKKSHEEKMRSQEKLEREQPSMLSPAYFPTELVDQEINKDVDLLRKSRFFIEFDGVSSSLALARKVSIGELSGGSDAVKSRALAWLARVLSYTKKIEKAEEYVNLAKALGSSPEIKIAEAFICAHKGDKNAALSMLAAIDSPLSRSAALMVVAHHEKPEGAIGWLKIARIDATDLDPVGKYALLTYQLQLGQLDEAKKTLDALNDNDFREAPVLHHMVAITHLLSTVPNELRTGVLNQIPFEAAAFPLASDASAINARRTAHRYFIDAAQAAKQLNCPLAETLDDEYALWLELKDPDEHDRGKIRLQDKLRDPKSALRLVHLGIQFGIKLDLDAVEREIERQIALHGDVTHDAAIARFALAFIQKTPEDVANYISRHKDQLSKYIDKKVMQFLQIDMLSQAGRPEKANECLDVLLEEGLSAEEESRLRRKIGATAGSDPVEAQREQFKKTNSLGDLVSLVDTLETRSDWDGVCEYGQILFQQTRSLHDAERLVRCLSHMQKNEQIIAFLDNNDSLLPQSKELKIHYCWALYHEGALLEARAKLAELSDYKDNLNYRALQVNLGVTLGDWTSLATFVANECLEKNKRSAKELISAAQLALHLNSPHAKDLIFAAASKGNDNAAILAAAYFLASSGGWENDAEVFQWLQKAAALSGDDGPIQKMTLKDILDRKPAWDRREAETCQLLSRGEIPMFLAAQSLNKSLIQLMLFPALTNSTETDPRRRGAIPAYSGKRQPSKLNTSGEVGIDATALLTLSFLNLLDEALDSFEAVHVPHSTLRWLFQEKQNAAFHQPSRIKDAHQIRHLLATGALEKLSQSTVPDSELSAQVGEELAQFIAEAEKVRDNDNIQRIVVRSSPVHRLTSLMQEEADMTAHATVLSSCQYIIDKLRQGGQITAAEEEKARAYLHLHEKPWTHQPDIGDGAILYLDDLTVTYFLHLGILQKLKSAGFRTIISTRKVSETNELISYENISSTINDTIERIRFAINSRIESGKIKVGRRCYDEPGKQSLSEHPTFGVMALAADCNAIIVDDRFLNQHTNIDNGNAQSPLFSTLDLLDALLSTGSITSQNCLEYRTLLRRAGYFFVPVAYDELAGHLSAAKVKKGKFIETAELKAIRENMLCVRMSTWLQLPKEAPWLDMLLKMFNRVMKGLWRADVDYTDVRARSNWIMDQVDIRGWAHSLRGENRDNIVKIGRGAFILSVLLPPDKAPRKVRDKYWSWVEDRVLAPIKEQYDPLYSWIVEWQRREIAKVVDIDPTEDQTIEPCSRTALAQAALGLVPPLIQKTLIENADFRKEYDFTTDAVITLGDSGISIKRSVLFAAARKIFSGASAVQVTDKDGKKWKLTIISADGDIPILSLSRGERQLRLPDFSAFSPNRVTRLGYLEAAVSDVNLPGSARNVWHDILMVRALEDEEADDFYNEFRDTPTQKARAIHREIVAGESSTSSLVPRSHRYYERLIGLYDDSESIRNYAAVIGRRLFDQLIAWRPYDGFLFCLLLSSHSSLTAEINVDQLSGDVLGRAFDCLDKSGDRISQLGAIEVGLRVLHARPELEPAIIRLVKQIRDDNVDGKTSGFKLLSALFILVDGELSKTGVLSTKPPFYRRLAALSQASLINRQIVNSAVDIDRFSEWAFSNRGRQFYLQSLADMRLEPRWNPELASPSQMKADFFGRIMMAAKNCEQNIRGSELLELILSDDSESLQTLGGFPDPYLPGALEGAEDSPVLLPVEIREMIDTQLRTEKVGPSSFIALVNSALIFRVGADHAELAANALKLGSYRLTNIENRSQLISILNGLATVAAVARSRILADELRILARRYRCDPQYALSIEEAMRISLVAAASRVDLNDWRDFAGDWLTELAFGDLEGNDEEVLHSHIECLCHVVPELWVSCGRADAALMACRAGQHST